MIKWNGDKVIKKVEQRVQLGLEILGVHAVSVADELAPYQSGRLRGSITYATKDKSMPVKSPAKSDEGVEVPEKRGVVRIGSNVVYAAIQEFGGMIEAKKSPYLMFKVGGKFVKTKRVNIPGKFYLTGALEDTKKEVKKVMSFNL